MPQNIPRDHHYVPQFYLRNFATDPEKQKLTTVAKHGHVAVWAKRSIKSLGFERDLYVSMRNGVPVSVENIINERIETPISESDVGQARQRQSRCARQDGQANPVCIDPAS
ncbi:DUF4238 domain-containing protein [Mesorhizobium sp. M0088]|uniref:DUF4238 domain-containing protein n=1 Tax=Mesorhizobium sp. M0088 TaxID=2956873 RepID=UPI003338852F